ncbi:TonB-dependent receptor [candidate division WOR-3 bacterium]|nr:TonB-dependent receptor [candidate division WOR-3 bacterium]
MVWLIYILPLLLNEPDIKVSGYVRNKDTGLPLTPVGVFLKETGHGTYTDERGHYSLRGIPEGKYILTARMIGFITIRREIEVRVDKTERVDFYLVPSPIEMGEIVVSAQPSNIITITREDIEKSNHDDIGGILNSLPGISVRNSGTTKLVSIRGCDPNKVAVLLDGVPMNDEGGGTFDISTIPKEVVERIEIVYGGSILYGEDAIGGVINIVTSIKREKRRVGIKIGSFNTRDCRIAFPPFFFLQFSKRDNSIYKDASFEDVRRENSSLFSHNFFLKIPYTLGGLKTVIKFQHFAKENGMPGAIEQPTPGAGSEERKVLLQGEITFPHLTSKTYLTGDFWRFVDSLSWSKIDTYHRNITYGQILTGEWDWCGNNISYGCSYRRALLLIDDGIRPESSLNRERDEGSLWLKNVARFGSYTMGVITSCIKFDIVEGIHPLAMPKIGVAISRGKRYIFGLYLNWSKSYRVPSFHELFWVPDVFAVGNPNLLPERATNLEYGLNISLPFYGMLRGDIAFFYTDIYDVIIWRRRLYDRYSPENVSRARICGREERISWEGPYLKCEINHTSLDARNYGNEYHGNWLVLRPKHRVTLKTGVRFGRFYSNLEARWVDERYIREANTKWLPPYCVIDANVGINANLFEREIEIRLESCNLGDESYEILERYPMPKRSWAVSFNIYF